MRVYKYKGDHCQSTATTWPHLHPYFVCFVSLYLFDVDGPFHNFCIHANYNLCIWHCSSWREKTNLFNLVCTNVMLQNFKKVY